MKIWSMNLQTSGIDSFNFCKKRNIIGIGWGLQEESTNDWNIYKKLAPYYYEISDDSDSKAFRNAIDCMDKMETGDLVWIRDPNTGKYYICEVLGQPQCCYGTSYVKADILSFRPCNYHLVGYKEILPKEIDSKSLISRPTIRPVKDELIIEATLTLYKTIKEKE